MFVWDKLIEGEKFQVLKQETIDIIFQAQQIIIDATFTNSIKLEYELIEEHYTNEDGSKGGSITYLETSDYLEKLRNIYNENTEDIQKIISSAMNMQHALNENEAYQAYMNLVKTEAGVFLSLFNTFENSNDNSLVTVDIIHAYLEALCKLIKPDEYKKLYRDPEALALALELNDEISSHDKLITSLIDFLIEVETDLFDCFNELLTIDTNKFQHAYVDFFMDQNTHSVLRSTDCDAINDVFYAMCESKTIKSMGLLREIIEDCDTSTMKGSGEHLQINRLLDNHEQLLENLGKNIEKKLKADWGHDIDEGSEFESDSAVITLENVNDYDQIVNNSDVVLVDFYADWCGPCKMLKPHLVTLSNSNHDITVLAVNVDKFGDVVHKANVRCMPTLVLFKSGVEVARHEGCLSYDELLEFVS